ncbi:MAG: heme lyase CcmF/NrfE family subunit [Dongiaceae bacterium]
MIPELGHFALVLAFLLAIAQSILPLVGAARRDPRLMATARPAAEGQMLFIALAFAALTWSFVTSDFSVAVVAHNSHSTKPLLYQIAGVWGNHEGSLLLWVSILAVFGLSVAWFGGNLPPPLKARVLAVQGMIAVGFIAFMLFASNPFARLLPAPPDGEGLNPILQDPGLAMHPPMLYLGYVGFSMAFSFAVAALIEGKVDAAWARWVRPWTLAAWVALTLGIALGSHWAYYTLGWGGWWYWDPVENASLMPWLSGTALLHSAIVVEKRDALKSWTILLAIATFALSLIGTFLVRSGVLTSVHSFAVDPARGMFILGLLVATIGGSLTLFAIRAPTLQGGGLFAPISREGGLVLNNLLLAVACATVLGGTLYPLLLDLIGGGTVSVGAPYFDRTFGPLMALLAVALPVGPMLAWKRGDLAGALGRLWAALLAAAAAFAIGWWIRGGPLPALCGLALGGWLLVGSLVELVERLRPGRGLGQAWQRARSLPRAAYGMTLAHAGLAVAILGITGASAWKGEVIRIMHPGESVSLAGVDYRFDGVEPAVGANYRVERGRFTASRDGRTIAVLTPERRFYPVQQQTTTGAALHTTLLNDLYAVLGEPDGKGGWTVRIYDQPLVPLLWIGFLIMALGGVVSLSDRRLRVGAPQRARRAAALPAAAPP